MSTSNQNRFDSGRARVSLSNFISGSCRVIVSGQTFPTLLKTHQFTELEVQRTKLPQDKNFNAGKTSNTQLKRNHLFGITSDTKTNHKWEHPITQISSENKTWNGSKPINWIALKANIHTHHLKFLELPTHNWGHDLAKDEWKNKRTAENSIAHLSFRCLLCWFRQREMRSGRKRHEGFIDNQDLHNCHKSTKTHRRVSIRHTKREKKRDKQTHNQSDREAP